ncbi:type VII secretion target [Nocardia callitridis]|uniref:ESX-1 secretion-associated protein n=1 Tax=Nocardia callitridis TaxID=648753 RepID=A0ABP9JX54_9NOCA
MAENTPPPNQAPAQQMHVDPEALRAFATALGTEASTITGLDSGDSFTAIATALPGTEFGPVAAHAADAAHRCLRRIGERLTAIADSTHDAAGKYELAEADFAANLRSIGLQLP